jgi:hypothetical protein
MGGTPKLVQFVSPGQGYTCCVQNAITPESFHADSRHNVYDRLERPEELHPEEKQYSVIKMDEWKAPSDIDGLNKETARQTLRSTISEFDSYELSESIVDDIEFVIREDKNMIK